MEEYCVCFSGYVADTLRFESIASQGELISLVTDEDYLKKCEKHYKTLRQFYLNCKSNHLGKLGCLCDVCKKILFDFYISYLTNSSAVHTIGQRFFVAFKLYKLISSCICSLNNRRSQMKIIVCLECKNVFQHLPRQLKNSVNIYQTGVNLHLILCKCNAVSFCGRPVNLK